MSRRTAPEPHTGLQGEGGLGGVEGREDAGGTGAGVRRTSEPDHRPGKRNCSKGRPVFSDWAEATSAPPPVDLKVLHAKIGELALENDFLEGALIKAGMLSAKR